MRAKRERRIWVSTFCNFAHDARSGAPIKHECTRLNPKAMELERQDRFSEIGPGPGQTPMYKGQR